MTAYVTLSIPRVRWAVYKEAVGAWQGPAPVEVEPKAPLERADGGDALDAA